jgi:iron complex outermembrane receptor protein
MKKKLIQLLHEGHYSCVIEKDGKVKTFSQRGIVDLYNILNTNPDFLKGAYVADKVVGKASAALMIAGGVKKIYTDIISRQALNLLECRDIEVEYEKEIPVIINRNQTDWCPMEKLCYHENSIDVILNIIKDFLNKSRLKTLVLFII